jgi:hypothetical protein
MILFCYFYDKNLTKWNIKAQEIFKIRLDAIKYIKNILKKFLKYKNT